jgi:hypothetical protein
LLNQFVPYLKNKIPGFLSSKLYLSWGSKLNLFLVTEKLNSISGFPNEKAGMREIPLLVTVTEPENVNGIVVLSFFWANNEVGTMR